MGSTPIGISGSRAGAILGVSNYRTPFDVFCDIMGEDWRKENNVNYEPFTGNEATAMGLYFEDAICETVEQMSAVAIYGREQPVIKSIDDMILTCHPDGFIGDNILYSAKTANDRAFWANWTDKTVPIDYQAQAQHEMIVTGREESWLYVLLFPDAQADILKITELESIDPIEWVHVLTQMGRLKKYVIERDESAIEKMIAKYQAFYKNHIIPGIAPDLTTYEDCKMLFHNPVGTIVCDAELESMLVEHKEIGKEIGKSGSLEKRREQLKVEMLKRAFALPEKFVDVESADKWVFMSETGHKLGSFNGKTFR